MPLWPIMLWPKPKSRQQQPRHVKQYTGNGYINLQFAIRTFAAAPSKQYWLHVFVINVLLFSVSIVEAQHRQPQQQQHQQQSGVSNNYEGVDVVSALTGLSNGYATPSYMKNYYQHVSEAVAVEQQNQHQQQQQHNADHGLRYEENIAATAAAAGIIGRDFLSLQTNNYANTINTKGNTVAPGVRTTLQQEAGFNIYDGGFVPTTFTNAGSHYAATLHGLQTNNAQQQQSKTNSATANNNNNLQGNQELYGNINDQNNYNFNIIPTTTDNNGVLQQSSSFRRLLNYANNAGQENIATAATTLGDDTTGHGNAANEERSTVGTNVGVGRGGLANYRLVYADDDQQSFMLQNFYNQQQQQQEEQQQQTAYNEPALEQKQNFANYFPQSATTATTTASAGYEIENPQKYYTLNNYQQQTVTKPQYQQEQEQQPQYQQQQRQQETYLHYQLRPYDIQQKSQQQNDNNGIQPATYFQSFIRHKNDDVADSNNREQHHYEHRHITRDNNQNWKQNQIMANYQQKQINIEKQQQQQQQQPHPHHLQQQQQQTHVNNHYQRQLIQELETAETTHHSTRVKKAPKHKNKRHDNQEHNFSYDTYEQNHIETETQDHSILQLEQLQQLQHQLHQQQQQFVDLQHQLIDHDQQLQIQKQLAQHPPPSLPPITHTVHHNSHSLQALAGTPLSKHTQIIKTIPIPQRQQIHIPYRENVTIEIPNPVITTVSKPLAIEIPVTKTVTIPQVQEVKIPIEKLKPVPVERPIPYIVEKRVPYTVEKQVAKPVYYPVPIKVPIVHTVIHKVHSPHYTQHSHEPVHPAPSPHHHIHHHQQHPSIRLPHNVYRTTGHKRGHGHSPAHHYLK